MDCIYAWEIEDVVVFVADGALGREAAIVKVLADVLCRARRRRCQ